MNTRTPPLLPETPPATEVASPSPTPGEGSEPATPRPAPRLDPTRYGDWELNGKCVDF